MKHKRLLSLFGGSLLAVALLCGARAAAQETVIYEQVFGGGGTAPLAGTAPTAGGGTWAQSRGNGYTGVLVRTDGVVSAVNGSLLLPFTPEAGRVYTLTVRIAPPKNAAKSGWAGAGFARQAAPDTTVKTESRRFTENAPGGAAWVRYSPLTISAFAGPQQEAPITKIDREPGLAATELSLRLDTRVARWNVTFFIDGKQAGETAVYAKNPGITQVGLSQGGAGAQVMPAWQSFKLTEAKTPAPATTVTKPVTAVVDANTAEPVAVPETGPITITFEPKNAFAFPRLILGTQDEVWDLPYASDAQWKDATDLGVKVIRYPAGTTTDWFTWDNPEKGYWPGAWVKDRKKMLPDDFIALCKKQGLAPMLCVNTGSYGYPVDQKRINPSKIEDIRKGADYAARWVKDFNIDKKYGVKYWQIGNEGWTWLKPAEYAVIAKEYSRAMRAVDPSITIIAIGLANNWGPSYPEHLSFADDPDFGKRRGPHYVNAHEWTRTLLENARGSFDYISIHRYLNTKDPEVTAAGRQLFSEILSGRGLPETMRLIAELDPKVRIANTEWMVNFSWDPVHKGHFVSLGRKGVEDVTYDNSITFKFVSALVSADYLGSLISSGKVDFSIAHTLRDGVLRRWNPKAKSAITPSLTMPAGIAMAFWNEHAGDQVVPVTVTGAPHYVFERLRTPFVSAYATRKEGSVSLILINRSPTASYRIVIPDTVDGRAVKSVREHAVAAPSWDTSVWPSAGKPEASPVTKTTAGLPVSALQGYEVKPSRLTCLELVF